jgi:predicted deacetylase
MRRPDVADAVVALHDVSPATWPECSQILAMLDAAGASPVTLLVIPDRHHRAPVRDDRAFCRAIDARLARGDETVLHGMYHVDEEAPPRTLRAFVERRLLTRGEGEFAALGKAEAAARIAAGVAMFEALGWPLTGFVPPAWLASAGARDALAECSHPFRYMSVRGGLYHLPQWRFERTANLCYSPTHAWRRAYSRLEIRNQWRRARRVSLLRLSLHPQDARVPQVLRHWERLVEQTLATRRIVTKRDAVLATTPRAGRSSPAADDARAAVPSDAPPARAIS